jgi:lysophospholipase L1-like esterase
MRLLTLAVVVAGLSQQPSQPPAPDLSCPDVGAALRAVVRNDVRLRDWAELGRYRDANGRVPGPAAGGRRVVFMGDSITDSWQEPRFGGFFPGRDYLDRGISGQTTPQMLVRFRPDVIDLNPTAVVILAGTNDIAGNTGPESDQQIEENLASMAELAKSHGIKVVLASITPTSAYHTAARGIPQTTVRPLARIKALNDWLKHYASENGAVYVDYFSAMVDDTGQMRADLTLDDLHPTAAGYAIMAPLAEAAIERALH